MCSSHSRCLACRVTTFPQSRRDLADSEALMSRICSALGIKRENVNVDQVWNKIWLHLNSYHMVNEAYTRWYLLDEVGLAISHSDTPNMRCCPLFVKPVGNQPSFTLSVAWPCQNGSPSAQVKPSRQMLSLSSGTFVIQ